MRGGGGGGGGGGAGGGGGGYCAVCSPVCDLSAFDVRLCVCCVRVMNPTCHLTHHRMRTPFPSCIYSCKTKSIAVSNFSPQQLDCIVKSGKNMTVPAVNQV